MKYLYEYGKKKKESIDDFEEYDYSLIYKENIYSNKIMLH